MNEVNGPLPASLIAKWFIARASSDFEQDLSNLKLQKLLYFAQSRFLSDHAAPLLKEDFQAWDHGPAVGVVYREYKFFRAGPIQVELVEDGPWSSFPDDVTTVLNQTWDEFGGYSALKLRNISHQFGPWKQTYKSNVKHLVIAQSLIARAWPEFAAVALKPVVAKDQGLKATLDHFEAVLATLPKQEPHGDPSFLLEELDSLEGLRKHAASQLL